MQLDKHTGVPLFKQLIHQFRDQILAGVLAPGEQLPSVRDLALELELNPMTVSKAYSLLEIEGVVERKRGVGLFVAKRPQGEVRTSKLQRLEEILSPAANQASQLGLGKSEILKEFDRLLKMSISKGENDG